MPNERVERNEPILKECPYCKRAYPTSGFTKTKSVFFPDGYLSVCNNCIDSSLRKNEYSWKAVDKMCQLVDIPFVPYFWEDTKRGNPRNPFAIYAALYYGKENDQGLDWSTWNNKFKELEAAGKLDRELPLLTDERRQKLVEKFGPNYDDAALQYLDNLYNGLLATQNVNGVLQSDQGLKLCKLSYEIDCRIRQGEDVDKLLSSYEKLVKIADFTPKNVKNLNDFDSIGELIRWCEKRGWHNPYYDGIKKDVIDEEMQNYQSFARRLYTNETTISDEIARRLEALKNYDDDSIEESSYYGVDDSGFKLDAFEQSGYEELLDKEEFNPEDEEPPA